MNKTAFATLAAINLIAATSAFAATNLVNNGSFEQFSGVSQDADWGMTNTVDGWTNLGGDSFEIHHAAATSGGFRNTSYDGTHYLELNANHLGTIAQTLATTSNQAYTLTFAYSGRFDSGSNNASYADVFWGSALVAHINAAPDSGWQTKTFNVIGTGSDTLKFVSTGPTQNISYGSYLDGVSVTAVPEPESYAMLLAGLGVMATIARRRNKAAQV